MKIFLKGATDGDQYAALVAQGRMVSVEPNTAPLFMSTNVGDDIIRSPAFVIDILTNVFQRLSAARQQYHTRFGLGRALAGLQTLIPQEQTR